MTTSSLAAADFHYIVGRLQSTRESLTHSNHKSETSLIPRENNSLNTLTMTTLSLSTIMCNPNPFYRVLTSPLYKPKTYQTKNPYSNGFPQRLCAKISSAYALSLRIAYLGENSVQRLCAHFMQRICSTCSHF